MAITVAQASPSSVGPQRTTSTSTTAYSPVRLPTFDLEVGWRYLHNPETGQYDQVPLTLLDILYPTEEDVDTVIMTQSPHHDLWLRTLAAILENYLTARHWLILCDVLIHWGRRGVPPKGPDLAAIPGGHRPAQRDKSYHVGRDGPLPAFVIEITSEDSRPADLQEKPLHYAAVGVKEMLIIDLWPDDDTSWRLLGYRLEDSPYYRKIMPDAEGGLTFETLGLRFVIEDEERIEVYDVETEQRLLTPIEETSARHKAEARAEVEATARTKAEARAAELEARLQELQARYQAQSSNAPSDE